MERLTGCLSVVEDLVMGWMVGLNSVAEPALYFCLLLWEDHILSVLRTYHFSLKASSFNWDIIRKQRSGKVQGSTPKFWNRSCDALLNSRITADAGTNFGIIHYYGA